MPSGVWSEIPSTYHVTLVKLKPLHCVKVSLQACLLPSVYFFNQLWDRIMGSVLTRLYY